MSNIYLLFEHAAGYALFLTEVEDELLSSVNESIFDVNKFKQLCHFVAFQPFKTQRDALEDMNCISENILPTNLEEFLTSNLPKKKKKYVLGVSEVKFAAAISEKCEIKCTTSDVVPELMRGIRFHFHNLVEGFDDRNASAKAMLGLGHSYSRAKVKFNVSKIDNMIIQSINLLDQLDKDINTFTMRVREWYSHHFPELIQVVPENILYIQCVKVLKDRRNLSEDIEEQLENILNDSVKAQNIIEIAHNSMGMDISEVDLENVFLFAERITGLVQKRKDIMDYLRSKMGSVAPNLAALIGDVVGARLIAQAGSLINLAKAPASTVQILGAEKALFRALKTRGNTPKYGLLYHSKFIGKAAKPNKGRISRYLANKCSVASRIDCFREIPTEVFGNKLKVQVEDRLKFYESGEIPKKNIDAMDEAFDEAVVAEADVIKMIKKEKKKAKKRKLDEMENSSCADESLSAMDTEDANSSLIKKKKKKKHSKTEQELENVSLNDTQEEMTNDIPKKKKKKKHSDGGDISTEINGDIVQNNGDINLSSKKKKKKRMDTSMSQDD